MGVSSDEENDSVLSTPPKRPKTADKPRKHVTGKFTPALQKEFPWLLPVENNDTKAQCKICPKSTNGKVTSFRCERSDIQRHLESAKHIASQSARKVANPTAMQAFLAKKPEDPLQKKVQYAEMKLAGYVAAHNEPFLRMDHLVDVMKDIFPDSQIAQKIQLKRTKTKGVVVNVLGQDEKENLVSVLKQTKFSILTDESTDIAVVKTSCILVRFYDQDAGRIKSGFWDLHQVFSDHDPQGNNEGATARRLFELIKESFVKHDVPFTNVIGFGSDGCNVMMGCANSVSSRMKELCPGLRVAKCLCHSLRICASEACKCLPRACEDLARNVYNFIKNSSKRQAQFVEFLLFLDLDILKILHPSQTRWLSLEAVIRRMLQLWPALKLYFDSKWLEERLESAERIHLMLNDPIVKAYYLFLQYLLPKITGMNELFQSEKCVATYVHERMTSAYKDILTTFMRRDYVSLTPLMDIRPDDSSKWVPLSELYLGVGVLNQLDETAPPADAVKDFKTRCRTFLSTLCIEMKKRYDFNDPFLQRLRCLAPDAALSQRERERTPSLHTLALLLPRIVDREDQAKLQNIDDQWRALPYANLPEAIKGAKNTEEFWHKLHIFEDEVGENPFADLSLFALETLSMPISNADCERKFSKINDIKTNKRNRLITPTICGTLHADSAVRSNGSCCVGFKPRQSMYEKMTAATIYNFGGDRNAGESGAEYDGIENLFSNVDDPE